MDPLETSYEAGGLVSNPAIVIVSLGAILGLVAAYRWLKVSRSVNTAGQVVKGPDKWAVKDAALWTSIALFVGCGGFLLGRFIGEF